MDRAEQRAQGRGFKGPFKSGQTVFCHSQCDAVWPLLRRTLHRGSRQVLPQAPQINIPAWVFCMSAVC